MSDNTERYPDPLIDEVRERRRAMLARYRNDLDKFFDAVERLQATHADRLADHRKIRLTAILNSRGSQSASAK
jgi:hypothetical protein